MTSADVVRRFLLDPRSYLKLRAAEGPAAVIAEVEGHDAGAECAGSEPLPPLDAVDLVETHLSLVALVSDRVVKVKKPVHYEFVDLRTLAARWRVCEDEVRLNRRLAPGVYLGVVPITEAPGGLEFNGAGAVAEYAVLMRRLPCERTLEALLGSGEVTPAVIERLGCLLAQFHAETVPVDPEEAAAWPRRMERNCAENFHETRQFLGVTLDGDLDDFIQRQTQRFLEAAEPLFRQRIAALRIRECHGDLRLEHIYLTEPIAIIDCVEFSDRFRNVDTAADLAFLSMELGLHGYHDLNRRLLESYRAASGDKHLARLLNFYRSYYAYVRGKVVSLRLQGNGPQGAERSSLLDRAQRLFVLAGSYALGLPRPLCVVVFGLMGSGKSTLARALAQRLCWPLLQSDAERKAAEPGAPPPAAEAIRAPYAQGEYSSARRNAVYDRLAEHARAYLAAGQSVVLDATYSRRAWRREITARVREASGSICFVERRASEATIRRRLRKREREGRSLSDGRLDLFDAHRADYEPPDEIDPTMLLRVTTEEREEAVREAESFLRRSASARWRGDWPEGGPAR
ncbi:MAG: AAA family ATPase [Candidatus Tectomicrobia bacterium]|nr:AAA family ATPase [Candidatus Tectomicrobia bacterium]